MGGGCKGDTKTHLYTGVDLSECVCLSVCLSACLSVCLSVHLFISHSLDDPNARVYGHLAYGVFDGFIHSKQDIFTIEPADR